MVTIADISIPSESFELGRTMEGHPDVEFELERVVPLSGGDPLPLFWVTEGDVDAVEESVRSHPFTRSLRRLTSTDGRTLFEARWNLARDGFLTALGEFDIHLLEATGTAEEWNFHLRFADREDLTTFNEQVTERGIPVTLRRLFDPSASGGSASLSSDQREAIALAYRRGYFDVPRRTTITELAEEFDISDSALSQRLRRGLKTLVGLSNLDERR